MSDLSSAIALAADVHANQVDRAGEPYILHPLRVMQDAMKCEANEEAVGICAVLHDVLEDNRKYEIYYLRQRIGDLFEPNRDPNIESAEVTILGMLDLLTRSRGQDYMEYIQEIKDSETWAITIKLADLRDNMTILRQPTLNDKDLLRIQKYHMAYRILDPSYPH